MFCIMTKKVLLLWITNIFANRKHTARKRENNERLIFIQNKELLRMNEDYYQMNYYRMKVHMTSLRYWLFIRTCFHTGKTILVDSDLHSWFEKLPVIVTSRKRILPVTHEIVPDSDRWLAVISCTVLEFCSGKGGGKKRSFRPFR